MKAEQWGTRSLGMETVKKKFKRCDCDDAFETRTHSRKKCLDSCMMQAHEQRRYKLVKNIVHFGALISDTSLATEAKNEAMHRQIR